VLEFARRIRRNGQDVEYLDAGGGFGIHYRGEEARAASEFAQAMVPLVKKSDLRLILEPGRFLVGNAGILLTKVLYVKENGKRFAICDSGMNHLIRPALYGAYHRVWPALSALKEPGEGETREGLLVYDVVGPVCESADFFAKDRPLPPLKRGDLLAVFSAGAYGMVMSSNYNSFPRPAEVLVEGREWQVARKRETYEDIVRGES